MDFIEEASKYASKGLSPLPIKPGGKAPTVMGWSKYSNEVPDAGLIYEWGKGFPAAGIGLVMGTTLQNGKIVAIDVDNDDLVDKVTHAVGGLVSGKIGNKGVTIFVKAQESIKNRKLRKEAGGAPDVEILSSGSQTVIPPSIHSKTGEPYRWVGRPLLEALDELQEFDSYIMDEISDIVNGKDEHFVQLNTMEWAGVDGGGNTHDVCVSAVAALVARGWDDEPIHRRIEYAKSRACERAGDVYDWPQSTDTIQEWIDSARAKGMEESGSKGKRKQNEELAAALAFIDLLGGPDKVKNIQGDLRYYHDGYWRLINPDESFQRIIANGLASSVDKVKNAYKMATFITYDPEFFEHEHEDAAQDPRRNRVCFANGTLNLLNMKLEEWHPEHKLTHRINLDWVDEAKCETYNRFILQTLDDQDAINLWEEFAGLSFVPDISLQKLLILKGTGANGKATMLNLLLSFHDKLNISSSNITALSNERVRTQLSGKLLNVSSEESRLNTVADDYLKRITGGDPVQLRKLYMEPFDAVLQVRFINALNEMPSTKDTSYAIQRRMMILPCMNRVEPDQIDIMLPHKLKAERQGVIVRFMRALSRLRDRREFAEPEASKLEVLEYMRQQDTIKYWMAEQEIVDCETGTASSDLYHHYVDFCELMKMEVLPANVWGSKLKDMGYPSMVRRIGTYKKRTARVRLLRIGHPKEFDV